MRALWPRNTPLAGGSDSAFRVRGERAPLTDDSVVLVNAWEPHAYEHEVFVLEGEGVVLDSRGEHRLSAGVAVYVAPDEIHQFRNTGQGPLKFLCLIPHPLRGMNAPCAAACGCG